MYRIGNLPQYKPDGTHMTVEWELPVSIRKGEDEHMDDGPDQWWVEPARDDVKFEAKSYASLNEAIEYGMGAYRAWMVADNARQLKVLKDLRAYHQRMSAEGETI